MKEKQRKEEKKKKKRKEERRKEKRFFFSPPPLCFTPKMVKNDVFLEKASAKWDFIVGARPEQERKEGNK